MHAAQTVSKMWLLIIGLSVAHPNLYHSRSKQCFPRAASEKIMGSTGVYNANIVAADNRLLCNNVLVQTTQALDLNPLDSCETYWSKTAKNTVLPATYHVVCIENFGDVWQYASASNGVRFNTFDDSSTVDVLQATSTLIVGAGAGGWAAAAAIRKQNPDLDITVVSAGGSTTEKSTGVVWFPDNTQHTAAMLKQATGGSNISTEWLEEYIDEGSQSYAYWNTELKLTPYAIPTHPNDHAADYTLYNNATTKIARSFTYADFHSSNATSTGGAFLISKLRAIAAPVTEVAGTLLTVKNLSATVQTTRSNGTPQNVTYLYRSIVLATGGNGHSWPEYKDVVLAVPTNTAVHITVAHAHNISLTQQHFWHLEFDNGHTSWTERWFAFDNCAADVPQYAQCDDYSSRAQSLIAAHHNTTQRSFQTAMTTIGTCPNTSTYAYWSRLAPLPQEITPCAHRCSECLVRNGIIDGKISFANMSRTFRAQQHPFFLSGTAAAAGSRDAYFAPGATIGFALHTGRLIATDSIFAPQTAPFITSPAPTLYVTGAWILLAGIAVKAVAALLNDKNSFKVVLHNIHYITQPAATGIITAAVASSHGNMKNVNSTHYYIGYTTLAALWILVAANPSFIATNWGNAHAAAGIIVSGFVAYLYISAFNHPSALYLYGTNYSQTPALVWTAILAILAATITLRRTKTNPRFTRLVPAL